MRVGYGAPPGHDIGEAFVDEKGGMRVVVVGDPLTYSQNEQLYRERPPRGRWSGPGRQKRFRLDGETKEN